MSDPTTDLIGALSTASTAAAQLVAQRQQLIDQVAALQQEHPAPAAPPSGAPEVSDAPPAPPTTPHPNTPAPSAAPAIARASRTVDASGWTLLPISNDARSVYVSSTLGTSANDGLSPDKPLSSIARAIELLREGFPDRLLLRCGDTFSQTLGNWSKSGRSLSEPMVIGSYGDGPRPILCATEPALNSYGSAGLHDLAIVGIHFTAAGRDAGAPDFNPSADVSHGIRVLRPTRNLLIEDCRVEFFGYNLALSGILNLAVRRCIVVGAWAAAQPFVGQGMYVERSDEVLIEECVFDHNGWNEAVPAAGANIYRHNLYLQSDNTTRFTIRGNIIARAASHGAWIRCGGVCADNLFIDNALHAQIAGAEGELTGNVALGGRDISAQLPRGYGFTLLSRQGIARGNLLANKTALSPWSGHALGVDEGSFTPAGARNIELDGNIVYGWAGPGIEIASAVDQLLVHRCAIQYSPAGRQMVVLRKVPPKMTWNANHYFGLEPDAGRWFGVKDQSLTFADWCKSCGETASTTGAIAYPDPSQAPIAGFLDAARAQSRRQWNPRFTAAAAIATLRSAFGM